MNISKTEDAVGQTDMSKKITSKPNHLIRVIYIVFAPTMPMISLAQDSPTIAQESLIEEVLVTARKREEGLQDIPSSAAAISAALIEGIGGIFNLRDMTDLVAGVSINENQAAESEPTIRGAGQARNRASASAVGLYRNGAYFATNGLMGKTFARLDTYDLERVEILRGPQGALYGRNALGGAMNLISKKPQDEFSFDVGGALGQRDFQRQELKLNAPINEQFGIRISHMNEERSEGFYTDIDNRDVDIEKFRHSRVSLRYQPINALDVNYVFDTQSQTFTNAIFASRTLRPDIEDAFSTTINSPMLSKNEVENHNLSIDWTLNGGTLTSVTNQRDLKVGLRTDVDYIAPIFPLNTLNQQTKQSADNKIFFQELRYVAESVGNLNWLIGADYFSYENTEVIDQWFQPTVQPNSVFRDYRTDSTSWAIFGSAEYTLKNLPVRLTGEIRYAQDEFDGYVLDYRASDQGGRREGRFIVGSTFDRANPVNPQTDFAVSNTYKNLPWGVTLDYTFDDIEMMAYGKIASSYRRGGMNLNDGEPGELFRTELTYDEETSLTYELGLKSSWFDRALTLNAAIFFTEYKDFLNTTDNGCPTQCQLIDSDGNGLGFNPDGSRVGADSAGFPIPPNNQIPLAFFIDNVGDAEAWGYEVEATYRTRFDYGAVLLMNLGYAKGKGKVTSLGSDIADATLEIAEGAYLPFLRPNQIKSSFVYRQPLENFGGNNIFAGLSLVASATYTFEEGGVANLTNVACCSPGGRRKLDTVRRLNANIGLNSDKWSLFLRGKNLTDHSYEILSLDSLYLRNEPRFAYVEFNYRF